jgi:hypothetical protein
MQRAGIAIARRTNATCFFDCRSLPEFQEIVSRSYLTVGPNPIFGWFRASRSYGLLCLPGSDADHRIIDLVELESTGAVSQSLHQTGSLLRACEFAVWAR